jgi:hypothetical protein
VLAAITAAYETKSFENLCQHSLPNLSVGHVHLTDDNYADYIKKYKNGGAFVLAASDSSCGEGICCHSEKLLDKLTTIFDSKQVQVPRYGKKQKLKDIQIARVDVDKRFEFVKNDPVLQPFTSTVPVLYVFYQGKYHRYENTFTNEEGWRDQDLFLHFMNKVLNPLLPIRSVNPDTKQLNLFSTEAEVDSFLDFKREPDERPA